MVQLNMIRALRKRDPMAAPRRMLGLALVIPTVAMPAGAGAARAATVPAPPTRTLPSALDVYVPYQGQTICDPVARPGVLAFARLMTSHYGMGGTSLIGRTCTSSTSEHYDGRAWDWMLNVANPDQEAVARSVLTWLTKADRNGVQGAMARRLGIMYIIHDRKMWRAYAPERGWAPYYGTSPHTDHIHFSFNYNGAAGRTSWWTGVAAKTYLTSLPPAGSVITVPTTATVLSYGMRSEAVRRLQVRLGNLPTTGYFGDLTKARVIAYQRFVGVRATGIADLRTQEILAHRGWRSVTAAYPTLSYGMTSGAVRTLQTKLGSLPTTGYFGSLTKARVIAYQRFVGLSQTGIADNRTQQLLYTRGWSTVAPASLTTMNRETTSGEASVMTTLATTSGPMAGTATPATARAVPAGVATVSTSTAYTALKDLALGPGSRGAAVRQLQRGLGGLAVDGVYGSVTRAAVVALQRSHALAQTGVVTPEVWDLIEEREFPFVGERTTVLRTGDTGPSVVAIQRLLGVRATGVFDVATRDAVKQAQSRAGLASTGVVASRTWSLFDRLSA